MTNTKDAHLYNVLVAPVMTEKANSVAEQKNQVVFKVLVQSTKLQIKKAFEMVFNTKVQQVSIINIKGKPKKFNGRFSGRRNNWKKAYITIAPGQTFDLATYQK